jgi:hypothetical protein
MVTQPNTSVAPVGKYLPRLIHNYIKKSVLIFRHTAEKHLFRVFDDQAKSDHHTQYLRISNYYYGKFG